MNDLSLSTEELEIIEIALHAYADFTDQFAGNADRGLSDLYRAKGYAAYLLAGRIAKILQGLDIPQGG